MGLDNFWEHPDIDDSACSLVFVPPLQLCGGMFSGNAAGSFRGRVYAPLIEHATGVSLYEETIPNDTVRMMADALEGYLKSHPPRTAEDDDDDLRWDAHLPDLCRMFRAYADAGFDLRGWW